MMPCLPQLEPDAVSRSFFRLRSPSSPALRFLCFDFFSFLWLFSFLRSYFRSFFRSFFSRFLRRSSESELDDELSEDDAIATSRRSACVSQRAAISCCDFSGVRRADRELAQAHHTPKATLAT